MPAGQGGWAGAVQGWVGAWHVWTPLLPVTWAATAPTPDPWPRMTACRPPCSLGAATLGSWPVGVKPSLGSQRKAHPHRPEPGRDQAFLTDPRSPFTTARSQPQTRRPSHICACTQPPGLPLYIPPPVAPALTFWAGRSSVTHGCLKQGVSGRPPPSVALSLAARIGQPQPSPLPGQGQRVHGGRLSWGLPPARPSPAASPSSIVGRGPGSREDVDSSLGCPCPWEARLPHWSGPRFPPQPQGPALREAGGAPSQAVPSPAALPTPH